MTDDQIITAANIRLDAADQALMNLLNAIDGFFDNNPKLRRSEKLLNAEKTAESVLELIRGVSATVPEEIADDVRPHTSDFARASLEGRTWVA